MGIVTHGDLNMAHRYPKNGSKAFILWFCDKVKQNESWTTTWIDPKTVFELYPNPRNSPLGPKKVFEPDPNQKKSPKGRIKNKNMGLYFHKINHAVQVFFKASFLGFVDAPVMCIIKYCQSHDQRASLESTLQNENAPYMILNSSSYS